jgi:hypothetical protein
LNYLLMCTNVFLDMMSWISNFMGYLGPSQNIIVWYYMKPMSSSLRSLPLHTTFIYIDTYNNHPHYIHQTTLAIAYA